MEAINIRENLKKYIDIADNRILKIFEAIVQAEESQEPFDLTSEQKKELDARLDRYQKGKTKFYTREKLNEILKSNF